MKILLVATSILFALNSQAALVTVTGSEAVDFFQNDIRYAGKLPDLLNTNSGEVVRLYGKYNNKDASCDFAVVTNKEGQSTGNYPEECIYDNGK